MVIPIPPLSCEFSIKNDEFNDLCSCTTSINIAFSRSLNYMSALDCQDFCPKTDEFRGIVYDIATSYCYCLCDAGGAPSTLKGPRDTAARLATNIILL